MRVTLTELARQRAARGLTQRELAAMLGIKATTLACVENAHSEPWPKLRNDCARVLDMPEDELFPVTDRGARARAEARLAGAAP